MTSIRRFCLIVMLLSLVLVWTGCPSRDYKEPISKFQKSVGASSAAIGVYYTEMNRFERELYLAMRLIDEEKVQWTDQAGNPTGLSGEVFNAESIRARLEALRLLGTYSQRLAELAGTDAPERLGKGMETLGTNLGALANRFSSLSNDSTAQDYTKQLGFLGKIAGQVGKMLLERKRDAALKEAIEKGDEPVTKILELIGKDMVSVIAPLRETGEMRLVANRVRHYNELIKSPEYQGLDKLQQYLLRKELLDKIQSSANRYEITVAFNPAGVVKSMREAHEALVKYAKSDRKPKDFAELVSAMEAFEARVQQLAATVHQLRNL